MPKRTEQFARKRTSTAKVRQSVVYWVTGAASVVSAVAVVSVMLVQAAVFNQSVLRQKSETLATLRHNIDVAPDLKADIRQLDTNEQLRLVRPNEEASALQTILDAMPADENRLALGASLQQRIFEEAPGVRIDALSVDPAGGVMEDSLDTSLQQVGFSATLSGSPSALRQALQRLERSVRAFSLTSVSGITQGNRVSLQITGVAYYFPPADLELTLREESQR